MPHGIEPMFFPEADISNAADANKWLRPGMMSSDSPEWYTPPAIIKAVQEAIGWIDLDPCADPGKTVPALQHFTEADDGLTKPWSGRVYMNPPYGRTIKLWTTKLRDEIEAGRVVEAVALLPVRTDATWWHQLRPSWVCFFRGRLQFSGYENSAPFPSAAAYFGERPDKFRLAFAGMGEVYEYRDRLVGPVESIPYKRRWKAGSAWTTEEGWHVRVVPGDKAEDDLVLEVDGGSGYRRIRMETVAMMADFLFDNERVLYPSVNHEGGGMVLRLMKTAMTRGWRAARDEAKFKRPGGSG
jgi:hypothetical protein